MRFIESIFFLFSARISVVAVNFLLIPFYLFYLNQAAVGLVTLLATLLAVSVIFDFGVSTKATLIAAAPKDGKSTESSTAALRDAEAAYWFVGIAIAVCLACIVVLVPGNWVWLLLIENSSVAMGLIGALMIGMQVMFGWLHNYYAAVLTGLQATRRLCISIVILSLIRLGAVIGCLQLKGGLIFVLTLLTVCAVAQLVYSRRLFNSIIAPHNTGLNPWKIFGRLQSFVNNDMAIIGAASVAITYADKISLSILSAAADYAIYAIAAMLASGLYLYVTPIYASLVPHFVKILAQRDESTLKNEYQFATEVLVLLTAPLAMILIFFSNEILHLWLRNERVVAQVADLLPWLVIGVLANSCLFVAYALQIASGWTQLAKRINVSLAIISIPSLWLGFSWFGLKGAAMNWAFVNILLLCVWPTLMHRKMIVNFMPYWLFRLVLLPCAVIAACVACCFLIAKSLALNVVGQVLAIVLAFGFSSLSGLLLASTLRGKLHNRLTLTFS